MKKQEAAVLQLIPAEECGVRIAANEVVVRVMMKKQFIYIITMDLRKKNVVIVMQVQVKS